MSSINLDIPNSMVIPTLESNVFADHPESNFAVGIIAVGNNVVDGLDEELKAYLRLRANVYADQTRMISKDLVAEDGTERDADDARSVHFAVFENGEQTRVVGAMRLIVKNHEDSSNLPIEDFFPEAFAEPAPIGSTEVSRYICRHETRATERQLKTLLYSRVVPYIMSHELGPTYAVVEPVLERALPMGGVILRRIAEPVFVPEYNDDNLGIQIYTDEMAASMGVAEPQVLAKMRQDEHKLHYFKSLGSNETAA